MGAHPEHGRRRPCSRDCCLPNPRAVEREHVRHEVDDALDWLAADAAAHGLYEATAEPAETR